MFVRQNIFFIERKDNMISKIAALLCIVGALNWGAIGAFDTNFVHLALESLPMAEKAVYVAVGVAGVISALYTLGVLAR